MMVKNIAIVSLSSGILGEEFAKLKKEIQNYRDAKKNVDQILQVEEGERREKERGHLR